MTNWLTTRLAASFETPSRIRSIRTSITAVLRPAWSGRASATISSPRRPAPKTFSFSSIVVKS